jgi:RNA polymerase sigma factor (sigma-70 family)
MLEALYKGDIAKYRGDASLATWLVVYARSRALDFMRHRYGRRRPSKWQEELGDLDKTVLRLYFVDRLPLEAVVHVLAMRGRPVGAVEIAESIWRIESTLGPAYLRRLEDEPRARALGLRAPRMIGWMMQLRIDFEERIGSARPDAVLAEKEAHEAAERVRRALERLPEKDRAVVALRFEKGRTAAEISEELDLGSERKAYTIIDRIVRALRKIVFSEDDGRSR